MNKKVSKKITVIGNCQAPVIAKMLRGCSLEDFEINSFLLHRDTIEKLDFLLKDDGGIVLSIPFFQARGNPGFTWRDLQDRYSNSKIHMISNAYFEGYHPYWGYFYNSKGKKLYPDWDDYINYWIVFKYLKNDIADLKSAMSLTESLNDDLLEAAWSRSREELAKRETISSAITNISSLLDSGANDKQLFWTFNHPSRQIFDALVNQILDYFDSNSITISESWPGRDFLSETKIPIFNDLFRDKKLTPEVPCFIFKKQSYSWSELVEMHIDFLSKQCSTDIAYSLDYYLQSRPEFKLGF
ncbi:WcbI family polysaccharide biosynthesis putative acetyltransferase [Synechococcus sp. AH-601-B19]|nr:WcbI family polysaccharide biosynthesis putative acetyltransferase [Synechococcus sp. AH-601-B19]